MAEQNGTDAAAVATPPTPWRLRLKPKPIGTVEIEDQSGKITEYPIMSVLGIPSGQAVEVLAAEEEIAAGGKELTYGKIMELGKLQVNLVCQKGDGVPILPSMVLEALSPNDVMMIRRKALGYDAANPPVPEGQPTPSAPASGSSPQLSGSSGGRRRTRRV